MLKELFVSECTALVRIPAEIGHFTELEVLGLSSCKKDMILLFLKDEIEEPSDSLKTLSLDGNDFTTRGMLELWGNRPKYSSLEHLDLSNERISNVNVRDLLAIYHPGRSLEVDLGGNSLVVANIAAKRSPEVDLEAASRGATNTSAKVDLRETPLEAAIAEAQGVLEAATITGSPSSDSQVDLEGSPSEA